MRRKSRVFYDQPVARTATTVRTQQLSGRRLHLEQLEPRRLLALTVTVVAPSDGSFLAAAPTVVTLDLSNEVLASTVEVTDLLIDGVADATAVNSLDSDTLEFTLPALAEGLHTLSLAAGSVTDTDGQLLEAFNSQFTVDLTAPQVSSSSLAGGEVLTAGSLIYTAVFSEAMLDATLFASDVTLVDQASISYAPTSFSYDAPSQTLTLEYDNLPEASYTLTLLSGDGQFEDLAGNDLDGGDLVVGFTVDAPFAVTTVTPSDGSFLAAAPTVVTLDLSDEVLASTVEVTDLLIDGVADATAVNSLDSDTLEFTLPALAEGLHTLSLAAGSVTDTDGQLLEAFNSQFTVDLTAPQVSSSSLAGGEVLTAGSLIYTAVFSEAMLDATLFASDVTLVDQASISYAPTSFSYDAPSQTLTLEYDNLPEASYTLTLLSGDGQFEDLAGNDLDGGDLVVGFTVDAPFAVTTVTPSDGSFLAAAPTVVTLDLSNEVLASTVEVTDLLIDGVADATAVNSLDSDTLEFTLPALAEGLHTLSLAAGSVTDTDGQLLEAFNSQFTVDLTAPQVSSSSLAGGEVLTAGSLIYTAVFSEAMLDATLFASDVTLVDQASISYAPTSFSYDAPSQTLTLEYDNLPEAGYTLTLLSGDGQFEDLAGNDLDGGDLVVGFTMDQAAPQALLFHRAAPLGSLIFLSAGNPGFINQTSDADDFQIQAPQDATLAVVVTPADPAVLLTLEVIGETFPIVAPGPGEPVVLAPWQVDANGTLELRVKGDRATTYFLDVAINATLESLVGDTTAENSLDLMDSELAIGSGRLAVMGTSKPSTEEIRAADSEANDTIATAIVTGIGIGRKEYLSTGEIGDNLLLSDSTKDVDLFSVDLVAGDVLDVDVIAASIASSLDAVLSIFDTDGQLLALVDDSNSSDPSIDFTAPNTETYIVGISGFANLEYDPFLAGSGFGGSTGSYQIELRLNGGGGATGGIVTIPDADFYEADWSDLAGRRVDVVLAGQNDVDQSSELLEILGPDGETVLATASPQPLGIEAENFDLAINAFVVPTAGVYTLRLRSSTAGEYTLLIGEEIVFDSEPDDAISGPLRRFNSSATALGYLGPEPSTGGFLVENLATESGGGGLAALVVSGESEPNNTLAGATPLALGFDGLEDSEVDVFAQLNSSADVDYYSVQLEPGDILSFAIDGAGQGLSLRNLSGTELVSTNFNPSFIYPATSPLLIDGTASMARVIDEAGVYYVGVTGQTGPYELNLRLFRPALESKPVGTRQGVFLDFDGETVDTSLFGSTGSGILSPLSSFLAGWGLSSSDENALIDVIVATVEENLSTDVRAQGNNGDYAASGIPGEFDIEILNSRDHVDPGNAEHMSRIVVGGTVDAFGVSVIGLAQFIDPGNFESAGLAVVLLDSLSGAPSVVSLNSYELAPTTSMTDFVGVALGNIVSHEAAHLFGAYHTNPFNSLPTITDQGGDLDNFTGLVGDIWGDGDEIDVDLASDTFSTDEPFLGTQNSLNLISFGLSTGLVGSPFLGPAVIRVDPPAGVNHSTAVSTINIEFSETLDTIPANHSGSYLLFEAGPNGILENGLADDILIGFTPTYDGLQTVQLNIDAGSTPLPAGRYRLVITDSILDLDGNPLNSKTGPLGGSNRLHEFEIFEIDPVEDIYQIDLSVGESVVVRTATPFDGGAFPLTNDLDPELTIFNPVDAPFITDANSRDGKNAELSFDVLQNGTYSILVTPTSGAGEYVLQVVVSLLGSFNGDNSVNGLDFLQWQRSFGLSIAPIGTGADGNADGVVDENDFQLWETYYGNSTQAAPLEVSSVEFPETEIVIAQGVESTLEGGFPAIQFSKKSTQHVAETVQLDAGFQWLGGLYDLFQDRWSARMSLELADLILANRIDSHEPAIDRAIYDSESSLQEISRTNVTSRHHMERLDQLWSDWQGSSLDDDAWIELEQDQEVPQDG